MTGVLALFDSRDALLAAMDTAKARQLATVTAFAPAYDEEILRASGAMQSPVGRWALAGGLTGGTSGLAFMIWTVRQWPALIVSGKPLIAWPPFLTIAFELTILLASIAAVGAFLVGAYRARRRSHGVYDRSVSDAGFALLISCSPAQASQIGMLMTEIGAVIWRVV
jgi:ActD protein